MGWSMGWIFHSIFIIFLTKSKHSVWTVHKFCTVFSNAQQTFEGNSEAYDTKENIFFPPLIGRYVRLYPLHFYNYPTVRLEYYGCELDGMDKNRTDFPHTAL